MADPSGGRNPWQQSGVSGPDYRRQMAERAVQAEREGRSPHGEVDFVMELRPESVLDAGCGTGRVAIEFARRGVDVVGVDLAASMVAEARSVAPSIEWVEADLASLDLGRRFDVVVAAGNVMIFLTPGTLDEVVGRLADHLADGGMLVAGFATDGGPSGQIVDRVTYDNACVQAGLELVARYATWEKDPDDGGGYCVSMHRSRRS